MSALELWLSSSLIIRAPCIAIWCISLFRNVDSSHHMSLRWQDCGLVTWCYCATSRGDYASNFFTIEQLSQRLYMTSLFSLHLHIQTLNSHSFSSSIYFESDASGDHTSLFVSFHVTWKYMSVKVLPADFW